MTARDGVGPRVVAFGGGHGLAASLRALRPLTDQLTAVVTVADDGGSSGRLRRELGALPPGDLRMAIAALAADDVAASTWADLLQHRFSGGGDLDGHAVGNLILTALTDLTGSPVEALRLTAELVRAHGQVLPLCEAPLDIVALVAFPGQPDAVEVRGQVEVATTRGRVVHVRLEPEHPVACPAAVAAARAAEVVVLGPGSLFTSVVPHLLVPEVRQAVAASGARVLLALNLIAQPGETTGFSPAAHLDALAGLAPDLVVHDVLVDDGVLDRDGLIEAAAALGARVHWAPLAASGEPGRHDPALLARAYAQLLGADAAFDGSTEGGVAAWR